MKFDVPLHVAKTSNERWCISNITAGSINHNLAVEKHGLFHILCNYLAHGIMKVQNEAIWAISNATCNCDKQIIEPLVTEYNVIECMKMFFKRNEDIANKALIVVIECIENILKCGQDNTIESDNPYVIKIEKDGLLDHVKELLLDECLDGAIWDKIDYILKKYWDSNWVG